MTFILFGYSIRISIRRLSKRERDKALWNLGTSTNDYSRRGLNYQDMDNKKGSKLHSIIEKLSEQCVRDDSAPSIGEESDVTAEYKDDDEANTINEDIVVVKVQPPIQKPPKKTYARRKDGRFISSKRKSMLKYLQFGRAAKDNPARDSPKKMYNKAVYPAITDQVSIRTRSRARKKLLPKPSQVCQPVDEDLCINVTALMCIAPQVKDIDNDHNYSCRPVKAEGGACRLCLRPVKNTKDFIKHFKKSHPECIKKPQKVHASQPEPEVDDDWYEEKEEDERDSDHEAQGYDSDYDPSLDPDILEAQDTILTKRKSSRLMRRENITEESTSEPEPPGQENQCNVDGSEETAAVTIKLDLKKLPSKKISCRICKKKFYFKIELTSHLNEKHSITEIVPDTHECEHCNKNYSSGYKLMKHIKKVVNKIEKIKKEDEFYDILEHEDECDRILKEVQEKKLLQRFPCDQCDKKFVYQASLNKHRATHSEDRPFGCKECGKGFKSKEYLRRHMITHSGEKKYKCDICDARLAHRGSLRSHRMIHTGERPYKCQYCDAGFVSSSLRKDHENVKHLGRMPYKCSICSREFAKNNHLKMHIISHSNEKPYPCEVCGKAFKRRDHLRYHLIIHSDVKPYKCDTCGRTFNQHICLRKHLPCRESERQAKKKAKAASEQTKPKKSKNEKTELSASQSSSHQETEPKEEMDAPPSKKAKLLSKKKNKKSNLQKEVENAIIASVINDVEHGKTPLKQPALPLMAEPTEQHRQQELSGQQEQPQQAGQTKEADHPEKDTLTDATVQDIMKTNDKNPAKESKGSKQKRPRNTSWASVTEKHSNKKLHSTTDKTKLCNNVGTDGAESTVLMPPLLERHQPQSMGGAESQKDSTLNFDRLDFGFQASPPVINTSSPGNLNLPLQRLLESSYMSNTAYIPNIPQTFVPFNCTMHETASVVFESGGLDIYQGVGSHDNLRTLSHESAATDLSSALLAAMDPDHLNSVVSPGTFYPQT